jgi:hypothetical protein
MQRIMGGCLEPGPITSRVTCHTSTETCAGLPVSRGDDVRLLTDSWFQPQVVPEILNAQVPWRRNCYPHCRCSFLSHREVVLWTNDASSPHKRLLLVVTDLTWRGLAAIILSYRLIISHVPETLPSIFERRDRLRLRLSSNHHIYNF